MGIQSKVLYADLDSWLADTLGGAGNGRGDRMGVGMGVGDWAWQNRSAIRLQRPTEFASIPNVDAITAFDVFVRASNNIFAIGSAVKFYWERGTTDFTENSEARREYVTTSGPATGEWPGPTRETANRGEYIGSPVNNDWLKTAMLAMGKWWYQNPAITALILVAVASDGAGGYAESTTARRCAFYAGSGSPRTGSIPYAELKWNDNQAPNIPIDLLPAVDTKISSTLGTQATVSSRHTDPEGDSASKYQAQWYPNSATDAAPGTPTKDDTIIATTAHNGVRSHTFTGLPTRTAGKWRMRFYDGQWGPWSLLQAATTAYKPTAVNLAVEPGTLTPKLYVSIQSGDATDYITAVEEIAEQYPATGSTITKLASGKQAIGGSPTRSEYVYNGTALGFGAPPAPYGRRVRLWNRDDVASDWVSQSFTQYEPTGSVIRIGSAGGPLFDPSSKIDTLTPTLYVSDPTGSNIDQARLRLYNEGGTLIYDSTTVSFASAASHGFPIPAGNLTYGMNPQADAADRVTGNANLGPYSEKKTGHVNAQPGSPYPVTVS